MKRLAAVVLAGLIAIPSVTFGPSGHIVRANGLHYKAVPLESLGIVQADSNTASTPFSFSASIFHKTSYTWNDHGFLPGTYYYSLLPLDDQGHNMAGWSAPTQFTIASS
jgi:hypothetical protein